MNANISLEREGIVEQSHVPGERASIRFFNPDYPEDVDRLYKIIRDPFVQKWMEDVGMDMDDVKKWAGQQGGDKGEECLFAIAGSPEYVQLPEVGEVQGFINTYEIDEKLKEKLAMTGMISPDDSVIELSYARNPMTKPAQVASALLQVCFIRNQMLGYEEVGMKDYTTESEPKRKFMVFVDPNNLPSVRVLQEAGFVRVGQARYDDKAEKDDDVYLFDWKKAQAILRKVESNETDFAKDDRLDFQSAQQTIHQST